jgi:hypothetical protein
MNISAALKIVGVAFFCTASFSLARVCDTIDEVEGRYGKPIPTDHPMMDNVDIAALTKWPDDCGLYGHARMISSMFKAMDMVSRKNGTHLRPVVVIFWAGKTLVLQVV